MRRFTLISGMGEAELQADPDGVWVPVADYERLQKRVEDFASSLEDDAECSFHVISYLRSIARR